MTSQQSTQTDAISIADPQLGEPEQEAVSAVIDSGMLADGPVVREFEDAFASYCGVDHGVATSNGTTALHAALKGLGLGHGDAVVTTPFSFIASANAIRFVGATPIFAEIDRRTYNLDPDAVEAELAANPSIEAILAVHLYGLPAPMQELSELAAEYDVYLIEDAAQAHGAAIDGQPVGSFGDIACFSFYPTKNMTTGEGGMVVTDDASRAERVAQYINHGRGGDATYAHTSLGHNFRMTSLAAAIGLKQLDRLPQMLERRQANAAALTEGLAESSVTVPYVPDDLTHAYHQYTIVTSDRDGLAAHLADHSIDTGVYYPTCIHNQPAYDEYSCNAPVAEEVADAVLSVPVHPGVSQADIDRICEVITQYV